MTGDPRPWPEDLKGLGPKPLDWLVPAVLLVLREDDSYGYEIMERMVALGFEVNVGRLYRALREMEKDGVVESTWETSKGGPARRVYTITNAGEAYLEVWADALEQYRRQANSFLHRYNSIGIEPSEPWPEIDEGSILYGSSDG